MKLEKRSEYAKAWGTSFEVPPKTRWLTVDFRGYVFASDNEQKPVPCESSMGVSMVWDFHGNAAYVGKVKPFEGMVWQDMVIDVGNERYRLDQQIGDEVSRAIGYCSDVISRNSHDSSAYFAQMIRMIGDKISSKINN